MNLAEKLKYLREERNLSQMQLAKILGVNQTTVSTWELGKKLPDFMNIIKISKFFGITSDYLLGLENQQGQNACKCMDNML